MKKKIIIIGAGIAGLSAGCYAQMNGYDTTIFEMHNLPGGLCTAWERKGFIFDGCLHYLFGSGPGQPFNSMWEELHAVQDRKFFDHKEMMRIVGPDGKTLVVHSNPNELEAHMKDLSPSDAELIEDFCSGIRVFTDFDLTALQQKPKDLMTAQDWAGLGARMAPFAIPLAKWGMQSAEEFGEKFKDPFLKNAIPQMFAWTSIPTMVGMSLLAMMHNKNAGFPAGGSLEFARAIEKRYLQLGGKIFYRAQVERILVKEDCAVGVRLFDNEEYYADHVVSACDGHATLFSMLDHKYLSKKIRKMYDGKLPIHSQVQVSLGVDHDFSSDPHWITYLLDKPVTIAGADRFVIGVKHYSFDPRLAPEKKSVMTIMLETGYDYWQRLYGRHVYDVEQSQEAETLVNTLEQYYPGLKGKVEVMDVATPLSYERYTGNWQGSSCGWLLTKDTMMMMINGIPKKLPGLANFYLAGQWVEPGGSVPVVAMSGKNVIMQICHEDNQPFVSVQS
jgi:phytoene dehydrogenase-like protein